MKRSVFLLVGWLAWLTLHADNVISLSSVRGAPDEEVTVSIALQNSDAVAAMQVSIPLDEQLSLVANSATLTTRAVNHQVTVGMNNGSLTVLVYSTSMSALNGTEGDVVSFRLKLGKEPKDIALTPSKVLLTQSDGTAVAATSQSGSVSIRAAKAQYGSMEIDFGHVPIRSTYSRNLTVRNVGNEPLVITSLDFSDVNVFSSTTTLPLTIAAGASGQLNVTFAPTERGSIEKALRVVCNNTSKLNAIKLKADPFAVNELHIQNASGICDEEVTVHLTVNNMDAITGFQFEFALPDQLKYVDGSFALSERKANHTLMTTCKNGVLRAICYSSTNSAFSDNDGEIASFRVRLDGRNNVQLNAQKAVLTAQIKNVTTDVLSAKYGATISIQSPRISVSNNVNMGKVPVTEDCTTTLQVYNYGNAPLTISRAVVNNEALTIGEELPVVIAQWESRPLTLTYNSVEQKDFEALLQLYTNDPTNRLVNITVEGNRFAPNYVSVNAKDVLLQNNLSVEVCLDTYDDIGGMQFDVVLPTTRVGNKTFALYQPTTDDIELTTRAEGMTVSQRMIDANTVRYFCYFLNGSTIASGNGPVMTLTFEPQEKLVAGDYAINVQNISLGTSALTNKYAGAATVSDSFTVLDLLLGDVNGDGLRNVQDVVLLINKIVGNESEHFIEAAANMNGDKDINVQDVVILINLIVGN